MLPISVAQSLLGIYVVLLAVGGFLGYKKAGSRASLIAGLASAAIGLAALLVSLFLAPRPGLTAAAVLALLLTLLFSRRYLGGSRKFMPSGLLAVVSLVVFGVLTAALVG